MTHSIIGQSLWSKFSISDTVLHFANGARKMRLGSEIKVRVCTLLIAL